MDAEAALREAWRLYQTGERDAAERAVRRLLRKAPGDAEAWCCLGIVCHAARRPAEAIAAYRRALQLRPHYPEALNNLGNSLRVAAETAIAAGADDAAAGPGAASGRPGLEEALACFDAALALDPDYVTALRNRAVLLTWWGRIDEAVACFRRALDIEPDHAETHKNLGVALLLRGDLENGWPEYEWRIEHADLVPDAIASPRWRGEPLGDRHVLLLGEQGIGDNVHFARFAARLKAMHPRARVTLALRRGMLPLLAGCPGPDALVPYEEAPPPHDVHAALLSLPGMLGARVDETLPAPPYLRPDPARAARWRREMDGLPGVRIGICWRGNPAHPADHVRSAPLLAFQPLSLLPGVTLLSLQMGSAAADIDAAAGRIEVTPLAARLDESAGAFTDTAALLPSLDLVVTVDTSVAHVAGALGAPVWVALAPVPDWRWGLAGERTPWYPSMRLFRRAPDESWTPLFRRIAAAVRTEFRLADGPPRRPRHVALAGEMRLDRTRHGLLLYDPRDRECGADLERYGEHARGELDLLGRLLQPGQAVVDAGAGVGVHALALAARAGSRGLVLAFEEDADRYRLLDVNLTLNGHDAVRRARRRLGRGGDGTAALDRLDVPRCHLLRIGAAADAPDLLAGAERILATHRPIVYTELVPGLAPSLALLRGRGYRLYRHAPVRAGSDNWLGASPPPEHRAARGNLLAVHARSPVRVDGLAPLAVE